MNFFKKNAAGIAELLISIILTVGVFTLFKACGLHEGKAMACHWAENTVKALGIVFVSLSVLRLIEKEEGVKKGIALAFVPLSVLTFLVPGKIISLCMMDTMRCQTTFKPFVIVLSVVLALISLADVVILSLGKKNNNKQ